MVLAETTRASSRARKGSPVRQVLTLFGDYWWHVEEPLPSGAVIAAMGDLGVKEPATRATLSRMVQTGLLDADRVGRRTTHALTARAKGIVEEEAHWLETFGSREPQWDGLWSVLAFSIPESRRAVRHSARSRLKWLGFAPLYDGLWISPLDTADEAMAQLRSLGVDDVTSMRATLQTSFDGPQRAWDLAAVAQQYAEFEADLRDGPDATAPAVALCERSRLMLAWQAFRGLDAGLPAELLPDPWPRAATRRLFAERYDQLAPKAEERMREHVAGISPELAASVTERRLGQ
ncbi:PaaX family transcriptional regulator [Microbacterium immunditiarum]|uniref:Phenylacetic acid degradation operon negative regulatory protein n=1 Tax=Microbacterium immunditiarum TaxID=337480 RepID=A0A7Y9GKW2_9MICO|nr:PaaX family transcriptional regulator C-terminal domain-containing protein [Microbacterium immunditiarum]NYE18314.1 phenylacetic acid degradation operon negative regulatory protein [Microbacterium immunditiarum]